MNREGDHKVAIGPCAERGATPAAAALCGGALERGGALPERDPIVLELGGGAIGHDADHRQATLGEPGGLAAHLSAQVDRKTATDGGADGSQVGPGAQVMRVGPSCLQVSGGIGQHPQQIATDRAANVPQVASHVVAELRARFQAADGRNEVHLGQATGASGHGIPVETGVVACLRIASPLPCQGAGWGTAGAGRGADRDRASLVVAAAQRQCSVHRFYGE